MKKYLIFKQRFAGFSVLKTILIALVVFALQVSGQVTLPHLDPINYSAGQALQSQANWTVLNTGDDIAITSGNLSYSGLAASSGNKFSFDGAGIDAAKLFTQQTSGTVYYSFLLNVSSLGTLNATGGYFTGLNEGTGSVFGATVWTRKNGTGYEIGLNPRTTAANTVWSSVQSISSTVLVVVSYQVVAGTGNDVVKLWLNPVTGGAEPTATLSATNTGGTDLANLNRIFIRQDSNTATPFIEMDELRIGSTWASVTPAGAVTPNLAISASLNEATLDGATVGLILANDTFADATLDLSNFTLNNAPAGVSIQNVAYNSPTTATVSLAYDNTDFDTNINNFIVSINGSEVISAYNLTSNDLTMTAVVETLTVGGVLAFGNVCNGSSKELSFTISGSGLKAGTISLGALAGYTYALSVGGPAVNGFSHSGGDLASKTIYVTLSPTTANQTYDGNSTVSGGGAPSVDKTLTGNSTAIAQSITTNTVTAFAQTTATLRATSIIQGSCPGSTVQGFVYSIKSVNGTPTVGGAGVTNVTVALGNTSFAATALTQGTTYVVQAYLFNGTTYVYGGVQEFTTTFSGNLNNVTGLLVCLADDGGTISWTAPATGIAPTGYMVFALAGAAAPGGTLTTALSDYDYDNTNFSASGNAAYPATLGKLIYKGALTSADISGLAEGSNYSFSIFAYQDGGSVRRFSDGSAGSKATAVIAQDDVSTFIGNPSNNQVTLNWSHNKATSCFDEVMIVANQGVVTYIPSGDASNIIADDSWNNAGDQVVYKGTALSKAITGLTNGTEYCFKIFVRKGTVWSDGTGVCVVPNVVYCASTGTTQYNTGIRYVKFNTIENATAVVKTAGYTNFSTPTTTVIRGEAYPVTVQVNSDGDYTVATKMWLDWNHDGDFADSGEEFDLGTATNVVNGTTSLSPINITVPNSAVVGEIRMRVSAKYAIAATSCETNFDGEVEDYTVTVTQPANQEINIKGNNITIANNFDEPNGLNNTLFATTNLGSDSVEKQFTIENLGIADLNLIGTPIVNITGLHPADFVVTQQAVSPVVNGTAKSFKIKFHPTVAGLREATVSILSNDADENPYLFKIQGIGTCATSPSITAFPVNGPANTKVTFTSSVNDLTGATLTYNNVNVAFDLRSSGKIETVIPSDATDANFVLTLANGCIFTQSFDVIDKLLTDCEGTGAGGSGGTSASDIIIYEVYDENGGSGGIVTLYNRTGNAVNLSTYSIQRAGDYGGTYSTYANLTGTIASGAVAVIGVSSSECGYAPTGNGSFGAIGFNANDGFRLMKGSSIIDDVHAPNTVGYYLRRKNEFLSPKTVYDANEWTSQALASGQCLSSSEIAQPPVVKNPPVINVQPAYNLTCAVSNASLAITATEGFAGGNGLEYQWYELANSGNWTAVSNNGIYSGANSQTLNISNVNGLDNYQYYCQVRENLATCYMATKAAQVKSATNTWSSNVWSNGLPILASKVIIEGDYNSQENGVLDVCELTVNSTGTMLVKPNFPIKVKNKINNQNTAENSFVVESDANLIQTDNVTNSGNIKVERAVTDMNNISGRIDYVYWSSPVSGQAIKGTNGFSPNTPANGYLQYNESTDKFSVTGDATFQTGKGYAIRAENILANGYNKTYSFKGVPNNGNLQFLNLQKSAGTDKGYNLVGNPYPSNIDFDLLYSLNSSKIYNTAWFWTNINYTATQIGSGYTGNNYAVYNGSGGVPPAYDWADYNPENPSGITPNGNVKVGQAFIVQAKSAGALDFNNSVRITDNGTFYQKQSAKNRFWLTMRSPRNIVNTILIGYIPGATDNYEKDFDGELFVVGADSFFSVLGAKKLAIQGRADSFSENDIVTLGNVFADDGSYTIGLQTAEGLFDDNQTIYLKDKLMNQYINLSTDKMYTFTTAKGTDASRFEIVYKDNIVLNTGSNSKSDFVIYKDGNDQVIKSSKKLGKIDIFDASGKLKNTFHTNVQEFRIDVSNFLNGIYILKIENSGDLKSKKIIR